MTFAIAAAGTAGHVYPALAVADALVAEGVAPADVLFIGGDRMEAEAVPRAGYSLLSVPLQGLARRMTIRNLSIPAKVAAAVRRIRQELAARGVKVMLATGGYVTAPAGWAARSVGATFFVAEQNAVAGLANRVMERWAERSFGSFPQTSGLKKAEWVGNPIRADLAALDRDALRAEARRHYGLDEEHPVVGVMGGSLGAAAVNLGLRRMVEGWRSRPIALVHLTGAAHHHEMARHARASALPWRVVGFEDRMDLFYSACDLVVARSGGGVAELTAVGLPAVLVPGKFGSASHQAANAGVLEETGAAVTIGEDEISRLGEVVERIIFDEDLRSSMTEACKTISRPEAALNIARQMRCAHV